VNEIALVYIYEMRAAQYTCRTNLCSPLRLLCAKGLGLSDRVARTANVCSTHDVPTAIPPALKVCGIPATKSDRA